MQNEGFKELIIKLGVYPNDKFTLETIIQGSQYEIQSFKKQLKIPATEHVQTKKLAWVENEKEFLAKELI